MGAGKRDSAKRRRGLDALSFRGRTAWFECGCGRNVVKLYSPRGVRLLAGAVNGLAYADVTLRFGRGEQFVSPQSAQLVGFLSGGSGWSLGRGWDENDEMQVPAVDYMLASGRLISIFGHWFASLMAERGR
jgi:hypothetical protein